MSPKAKKFISFFCILLLVLILSMAFLSFMSSRPDNLGLKNSRLADCPSSPNCVCSFEEKSDEVHYIEALSYKATEKEVLDKLKEILKTMPRTKIIEETENYIYAECTSLIFRFVDDLEIYMDSENKLIHFRSASRVGHSDLGVNRKRVNSIKEKLKGL